MVMVHRARDTIPRALTNQSRRAHSRRFSARAASNIAKKFQTLRSVTDSVLFVKRAI